jgi:hypothetical protein
VSSGEHETINGPNRLFARWAWGASDLAAVLVITVAFAVFFGDALCMRGALFYFDITEINYPYRAFLADELRAGRFSRWCPDLYCGLPLFSESQAGYLHPLKYLLYPWLETWRAFNLDTILSVWLTAVGTYLWLRRHVGPAGALTGAFVFGASGYVWGHLIHTSMINALASVPFVVWGLEWSWETGRRRGAVLAGLALACQVFAGHLQDSLLTICLVGLYALYRAATERGWKARARALEMPAIVVAVGVLVSAIQWVPSKELLDRSPRAGGLLWKDLIYGSWCPELLPTLVMREAYGTRARNTDWMDGFYPYHEMNAYMGLLAMALAVVGAGGAAARDRWVNFWVIVIGVGAVLMLGRFTCLFDFAHRVPILGSSREPVRFHLWVSLAVAALASVGVERLSRPGAVSVRDGLIMAGALFLLSIPIMIYIYNPVWNEPNRWNQAIHIKRYGWLGRELLTAAARTGVLALLGWWVARSITRIKNPSNRGRLAAVLPLLVMVDLLSAHWRDVPTIDPRYWTKPPTTVERLHDDPTFVRVFGVCGQHSGEPGHAVRQIEYLAVRDALDWSLPLAWGVRSSRGNTPMISRRLHDFAHITENGPWRHDLEGTTHVVTSKNLVTGNVRLKGPPAAEAGSALIRRNPTALPRARLAGRPVYADGQSQAAAALALLGADLRKQIVVEDPTRPLPVDAEVSGTARITRDLPEHVVVETDAAMPSYLVLSDTYDPGWSATIDRRTVPIRPAYLAFRAVFLPAGKHTVEFRYSPAGFALGGALSGCGILLGLVLCLQRGHSPSGEPERAVLSWPSHWRTWWFIAIVAVVLISIAIPISATNPAGRPLRRRDGRPLLINRWCNMNTGRFDIHTFTWGSGLQAME